MKSADYSTARDIFPEGIRSRRQLAIDYLEPMLADGEGDEKNKGTVIAATVSGIFMISEESVVLMLKNYGYRH